MKTIGILGGMGPQASADLYQKIIKYTKATRDQDHIPVLLYSWPQIADRTASILNQTDEALPQLIEGARRLEQAGADYLAIACITAHYYIEQVRESVSIPVLNMLTLPMDALDKSDLHRILMARIRLD